jgi:hypothetical protein
MDTNTLISIIIPVVIIVIGSWGSYLFEKWQERKAELYKRKEDLYKNLVFSIKGFYKEKPDRTMKEAFIDQAGLARLYASDGAIRSLNNLINHLAESEEGFKSRTGKDYQEVAHNLLGEFMGAIRRDLGIKTKLSPEELGRTEVIK